VLYNQVDPCFFPNIHMRNYIPVAPDSQQHKMFHQHSNGSTTLPRGFRFHEPRTPEPLAADEPLQPSPPRPRLKVRRRNVSNLQAPTDHFLASVAAADVPIPTIELPQVAAQNISEDSDMPDRENLSNTSGFLAPQPQDYRLFSPPKTPMPTFPSEDGSSQRPDWSMGTPSPAEDYFQRPSSALSNSSDFSDDSFYSGSRLSRPSEDGSCTSPESDTADPFQFPISKGKGKAVLNEPIQQLTTLNGKLRSKTRKDAPWTKAQSAHLWSTYLIYLQDPTVTPFRIGASCIPPEGVCHRVGRETRRSWKGQKVVAPTVRRSSRLSSVASSRASEKSGSLTPTGENPKVYAQWPHSSAATRNHLRELCRNKDNTPVSRHRHMQSRSPTPFTKATIRARRTPEPRLSSFSTKDIAMSLTTSTAESMQPDGPLAKLAADDAEDTPTLTSSFPPLEEFKPLSFSQSRGLGITMDDTDRGRRLGSPFTARTYGPSSSKTLNTFDARPSPPRTQSDTVSGPHLRSPLRFDKPRSLNGTQKRRAQHDLEEELSPNGAIVRPSILNEQLFGTPLNQRRVRSRGFSLGDEALRHRVPGISPSHFEALPPPRMKLPSPDAQPSKAAPKLLPSATFDPPRLGSPFSESSSSTFPRRLFQDPTATVRRSAFATMHQTRRSIESFDFGEGPSLQSRLGQLDMKLKQIREREAVSKRQSSE